MRLLIRVIPGYLLVIGFLIVFSQPALGTGQTPPAIGKHITAKPLAPDNALLLQPGLNAYYFLDFFARDVRKLPGMHLTEKKGYKGKPILLLNHQFGKGQVFGSGTNKGVGIRMIGAIHFESAGEYSFQSLSNDGFQLYIEDTLVINDPKQHSDQLSAIASITIGEAGWYPLRIDYFQRKGTAALKLFWKTPQSEEMNIVPESAYAHHLDK